MNPISLRSAAPYAWWAGAGATCFASWVAAEYYVPEAIAIGASAVALARSRVRHDRVAASSVPQRYCSWSGLVCGRLGDRGRPSHDQ
jgi:hypothetical protein